MYKKIINNIIKENFILTIIINMDNSPPEELEILKMLIKDITKYKKILLNCGNGKKYLNQNSQYYGFKNIENNIDESYFNIFIIKEYRVIPSKIAYISGHILYINNGQIKVLKSRTLNYNSEYNIKIILRKEKLRKIKNKLIKLKTK